MSTPGYWSPFIHELRVFDRPAGYAAYVCRLSGGDRPNALSLRVRDPKGAYRAVILVSDEAELEHIRSICEKLLDGHARAGRALSVAVVPTATMRIEPVDVEVHGHVEARGHGR